jgi:hypothetical protein
VHDTFPLCNFIHHMKAHFNFIYLNAHTNMRTIGYILRHTTSYEVNDIFIDVVSKD